MIAKFRKFYACSILERWVFLQSLFLLILTKFFLAFLGFKKTHQILFYLCPKKLLLNKTITTKTELEKSQSIARMVEIAGHLLPLTVKCLPLSLVTWLVLHRHGIPADFRIGVPRSVEDFEAHAWVEVRGHRLRQRADQENRFIPFPKPFVPTQNSPQHERNCRHL